MPHRSLLTAALILCAMLLATGPPVQATDAPEPRNPIVRVSDIDERGHGSGFLIERKAGVPHDLYITAGHVVAAMMGSVAAHRGLLRLTYSDGVQADNITPAVVDFIYDFAILSATDENKSEAKPLVLDCGPAPAVGTPVTGVGYPYDLPETTTHGTIASKQGAVADWPEALVLDMTIGSGASGGPLLGPDGKVVGIMVGWLMPTGFSMAVPIGRVCQWLGIKEPAA